MPRIPTGNTPSLVSLDVARTPTQSVESAGMVAKAAANLAQGVTNIAADFTTKLSQAEARTKAIEIRSQYAIESDSLKKELESDDRFIKNPEGFASEYSSRLSKIKGNLFKNVSTPLQQQAAENALVDLEFNANRGAATWERNERVKRVYNTMNEAVNTKSTQMVLGFDPIESVKSNAELKNNFTSSTELFNKDDIDNAHKEIDNKMFDAMVQHYVNHPEAATAGLDILEDRHTQSENLKRGIDSEKVGKAIQRLKSITRQNDGIKRGEIARSLQNIETAISQNFQDVDQSAFNSLANEVIGSDFEDKKEILDTIESARSTNNSIQSFIHLNAADKALALSGQLKLSKAPAHFNAAQREHWERVNNKTLQNVYKKMEAQGADYAKMVRSDLADKEVMAMDIDSETFGEDAAEYVNAVLAVQEEAGISNKKVSTEAMQKQFSTMFNMETGEAAAEAIDKVSKAFGEHSGKLVSDMLASEYITQKQATVFFLEDKQSKQYILDNLKNEKEITQDFKTKQKAAGADLNDLMLHSSVVNFEKSINAANPEGANTGLVLGFKNNIELEYKRLIAVEGLDHDDAKERSVKTILDKNFSFTNNASPLAIPKKLGVEGGVVEDFVNDFRATFFNSAKKLDIKKPEGFVGSDENYLDHLKNTSRWIYDGNDSAQLYEITDNGRPAKIVDKNNQPIKLKYKDMNETFFDSSIPASDYKMLTGTGIKF